METVRFATEYHLRVLADDEKANGNEYNATFGGIDYPNMKAIIEKLTVSIEENIHPIVVDISGNDRGYLGNFRLYFTRNLAKEWLHRLSPCNKTGGEIKLRAESWNK